MYRKYLSSLVVIIPCYRARDEINEVVNKLINIGIKRIIVVDDNCPDKSYEAIYQNDYTKILNLDSNQGVGGAFMSGFSYAKKIFESNECNFIAKIDSDDQHTPEDLLLMLNELIETDSDLIKGNRYLLSRRPEGQSFVRKFGNFGLSFLHKLATGYWHTGDPINGMIVIRSNVLSLIQNHHHIDKRYLFESSLLASCSRVGAKVSDCPNIIKYDGEHSSLSIRNEIFRFGFYYLKNFFNRITREYFYPTFNVGAIGILLSIAFIPFSFVYGFINYIQGFNSGIATETGVIAITMMSFFVGILGLFFFLNIDSNIRSNSRGIYRYLENEKRKP